jgi:hypothetical protein
MHVSADSMSFQSNLLGELRRCVSGHFSQEFASRVSFDDISIEELNSRDEFDAIVSW